MIITKIMMIRIMETDGDLGAAVMTRESWSQLALRQPPVKTQGVEAPLGANKFKIRIFILKYFEIFHNQQYDFAASHHIFSHFVSAGSIYIIVRLTCLKSRLL